MSRWLMVLCLVMGIFLLIFVISLVQAIKEVNEEEAYMKSLYKTNDTGKEN